MYRGDPHRRWQDRDREMKKGGNKFFRDDELDDMRNFLLNCQRMRIARMGQRFCQDVSYYVNCNKLDNDFTDGEPRT